MKPRLWLAALSLTAACASGSGGSSTVPGARPTVDPVAAPPVVRDLKLQLDPVAHYALARVDSLTVVMAGADQGQVLDRTMFLTVTSAPAQAGRTITILIDSLQTREAGLVSPFALDSLRGVQWTGTLGLNGRMSALTASQPTLLGAPLSGQFRLLFPLLPADGARPGATWTDSTSDTIQVSAFGGRDRAQLSYRANDAERAVGQPVLPISVVRLSTIAGATEQNGQTISLSGSDSTQVMYRISAAGKLMAADGSSSADMSIAIPSVGQTLPARARANFSLTRLP
ncbi:MAG: hypothetical protein ABJC74_06840 [Gemmatimonadota bacterium]